MNFKRTPLRELAKKHPGSNPMDIRNYFPASCIAVIFGEPGGGKTTIVTDIGCHIDTGMDWRGNRVHRGIVWYIAAEDPYGVRIRMEAWYERKGLNFEKDTNIELIEDAICFAEASEVDKLISDVKEAEHKPSVIIIDTLVDTQGKYDLNKDMGLFTRGFERFRNETKVSIIIIHHCGHAAKDRPRNGSELGGKCDLIMPVKCDENGVTTLSYTKIKNGSKEKAKPLSWNLKGINTKWRDDDGEIITSVIVEPTDFNPVERKKPVARGQQVAIEALRSALGKYGVEDAGLVTVSEKEWELEAYAMGISTGTDEAKRKAFIRASSAMVHKDADPRVAHHCGRYWIPVKRTATDETG